MFYLCRNQVVGFYLQNVWKTPVEEWHFKQRCRSMTVFTKGWLSNYFSLQFVLPVYNDFYVYMILKTNIFNMFSKRTVC